jgi:hypothetical protein
MATTQASQRRLVGTSSTEGEPARKAELLFAATPSVDANSRRQSVPDREAGVRSRMVVRSGQSRIVAWHYVEQPKYFLRQELNRAWSVVGGTR